jgi:hypothetical protein
LLLPDIALANHATFFDIILHPFAVEFKTTRQALLVVGDVHSQMAMGLQQSFLSSSYVYDINGSSFYLLLTSVFLQFIFCCCLQFKSDY